MRLSQAAPPARAQAQSVPVDDLAHGPQREAQPLGRLRVADRANVESAHPIPLLWGAARR